MLLGVQVLVIGAVTGACRCLSLEDCLSVTEDAVMASGVIRLIIVSGAALSSHVNSSAVSTVSTIL